MSTMGRKRSLAIRGTSHIGAGLAAMAEDELEQGALFQIEGPDDDGCVWICSAEGRDVWCQNLGPKDKVAEIISSWLGAIDYLEDK